MTVYSGPPRSGGRTVLSGIGAEELASRAEEQYEPHFRGWVERAELQGDVLLFVVHHGRRPVGMIFLHDIDRPVGEAHVGYYLLTEGERGRGIGSEALVLLVDYVRRETRLRRLVAQTGASNLRSLRVAEKSGFAWFVTLRRPERGEGGDLVLLELVIDR